MENRFGWLVCWFVGLLGRDCWGLVWGRGKGGGVVFCNFVDKINLEGS